MITKSPTTGQFVSVDLPPNPEVASLEGMDATGCMVHVGPAPILLIAGEGESGGISSGIGQGKLRAEISIGDHVLKAFMESGDPSAAGSISRTHPFGNRRNREPLGRCG